MTLALGQAISKGERSIVLDAPAELDSDETAIWLASLRTYFPSIQVQLSDPAKAEEGNRGFVLAGCEMAEKEEARHRDEMREIKRIVAPFGGKVTTKETPHDALVAYQQWIERTFVDVDGRTTQTGKKQGERAARIKKYAKDVPLSDFLTPQIESIIAFWRTRRRKPTRKGKPGGPYSFTLCKRTIRLFKHFLRWLHKEPSLSWKNPADPDPDPISVVRDAEIKFKVETYSKEEVRILWQHASHFERRLLLLSLNCGFSISEIGSLDWHEVDGHFIRGLRPMTKVYGEFKMWGITRQALGTPKKKGTVFLTESGLSLIAPTKGTSRERRFLRPGPGY